MTKARATTTTAMNALVVADVDEAGFQFRYDAVRHLERVKERRTSRVCSE